MIGSTRLRAGQPPFRARVDINAMLLSGAASYRGAGIANYIRNVLSRLPALAGDLDLAAYFGDGSVDIAGVHGRAPAIARLSPWARVLWEQTALPLALARGRADLFHSMAFALPWVRPCRSVVTIYDLSFVLSPEAFRPANRLYLRAITRRSASWADAVIAISENTKRDIVRLWGISPDKVRVAPCGVDERFGPLPPDEVERFRRRHSLPEQMVLFIGTLEPRKNLVTLIEAYALLRRRGLRHVLVLAGGKGWKYEPVFEAVERLGLGDAVRFPGYVPADELPLWYNAASLFVYPSLYEGFGLPPLEAMACGTPVIVSDRASLPEVVGPEGITVGPSDVSGLADEMQRVLSDSSLAEHLSDYGRRRAKEYSWDRAARVTLDVYRSLLALGV
jgi:glycosyltransferase involved in cell wall biosynthesis